MEKCLALNGHIMAPSPDPRKRTLNFFLPCPEFLSHHAFPGKWIGILQWRQTRCLVGFYSLYP